MTTSPGTATTINTYKFSIGVGTESTYKYDKTGNGTEHTYTYDINERLKSATLTLHKDIISTNTYTYDKTDNITGIRGVSESLYNQKYTYDDMNRLTGASGMDTGGKSDDGSAFSSYVMTMSYDQMSSPQRYELTKMSQSDTKVTENEYLYSTDSSNPHAPMQIGDMTYTYSASGNPLTIEGSKISRTLTWDAENRLRELTDQRRGIQSRYTYNHTGERSLKRYGAYESMAVNGAAAGSLIDPKSAYSAYVSPYYVEHGRGTESGAVTKHYYAGAERLASKVVTTTAKESEESSYYYFTDHLGSTTHITDRSGRTSQYAAYTPYGELFREYKKVLPYKFNGKELDDETGYYYYGARYYDPQTALWFGTDPLEHKYPMNSPYVYCNGNPISRIDYNGMDWYSVNNEDGTQSGKWFDSSESVIIDGDLTYNHVGKTMSGFNADGSFVYGAQDGQLYNSASLNEVTVNADQSALMTRSIHSAQNDFLSSDYTKIAAGLMGGMMAGPAVLEYGYNAAVWSAPYVKSAAVATYNAGKYAYTVSSNAAKYYGSTAILNGVKWYGKARTMAECFVATGSKYKIIDLFVGILYGSFQYSMPLDAPELSVNPLFDFGSKAMQFVLNLRKLYIEKNEK